MKHRKAGIFDSHTLAAQLAYLGGSPFEEQLKHFRGEIAEVLVLAHPVNQDSRTKIDEVTGRTVPVSDSYLDIFRDSDQGNLTRRYLQLESNLQGYLNCKWNEERARHVLLKEGDVSGFSPRAAAQTCLQREIAKLQAGQIGTTTTTTTTNSYGVLAESWFRSRRLRRRLSKRELSDALLSNESVYVPEPEVPVTEVPNQIRQFFQVNLNERLDQKAVEKISFSQGRCVPKHCGLFKLNFARTIHYAAFSAKDTRYQNEIDIHGSTARIACVMGFKPLNEE